MKPMIPNRETLNPLELVGTHLPGFVHAVANHLATLSGNVELLARQQPPSADTSREMTLIREGAENLRDEINRLRVAYRQAFKEAEGAMPVLLVPALADRLADEFTYHGWEVQRAPGLEVPRVVRAEVRWLGHIVRRLLGATQQVPGLAVLQLAESPNSSGAGQFRVRLLRDNPTNDPLADSGTETFAVCRQLLATMGGTLVAEATPHTLTQLTLSLPLLPLVDP